MNMPMMPRPVPEAGGSLALLTELQSLGLRLTDAPDLPAPDLPAPKGGSGLVALAAGGAIAGRRGGAGPTDHRAVTIGGRTLMVPVHNDAARRSPFRAAPPAPDGTSMLERDGVAIAAIRFPPAARFYGRETADGIPYWKIALLHGRDVLATTVLQDCIRYRDRATACQFCAIGQSLEAGRTIARKTPAQLAEVARAAVELDRVRHMVMTTGTPNVVDRGAAILCESADAVKRAVDLPIQAQCEPPRDHAWFRRLRDAGVDSLGMHLEAATDATRRRIMPGKATVGIDRYLAAFAEAVPVFGRGQVSTYLLAGLGDTADEILALCRTLIGLGVHPFVVPFVPVTGTPLANHPPPDAALMRAILEPLGAMLRAADLVSARVKAGCSRCGACSSLAAYEGAA